jgi:hypothetical protein
MLNRYELQFTPRNSRLLVKYLDFMNLEYPDELKTKAETGLIDMTSLKDFPLDFNESDISVLQYMLDYYGRCLILDTDMRSRLISLAYIKTKNISPCIILCKENNTQLWIDYCRTIWPDRNIFSNLTEFTRGESLQAEIIITQMSNLMNSEYLVYKRPIQFIFDGVYTAGADTAEIARNLASETYSCLFLMDILNVHGNKKSEPDTRVANAITIEIVKHFLHPDAIFPEIMNKTWSNIKGYLEEKKYKDYSKDQILELLGVNSDLIRYRI